MLFDVLALLHLRHDSVILSTSARAYMYKSLSGDRDPTSGQLLLQPELTKIDASLGPVSLPVRHQPDLAEVEAKCQTRGRSAVWPKYTRFIFYRNCVLKCNEINDFVPRGLCFYLWINQESQAGYPLDNQHSDPYFWPCSGHLWGSWQLRFITCTLSYWQMFLGFGTVLPFLFAPFWLSQ